MGLDPDQYPKPNIKKYLEFNSIYFSIIHVKKKFFGSIHKKALMVISMVIKTFILNIYTIKHLYLNYFLTIFAKIHLYKKHFYCLLYISF